MHSRREFSLRGIGIMARNTVLRGGLLLVLLALLPPALRAGDPEPLPTPRQEHKLTKPDWLPHYDLGILLDVAGHDAHVHQRVTFTNRHTKTAAELVFNVHSNFKIPSD